ncbi:hypothetical protein BDZ89DRAFT_1134819 [Hymenopellis radicata]|nr:hypothetical protein BDZ89DRAFT_1134819 [Hymenopellis radicata]
MNISLLVNSDTAATSMRARTPFPTSQHRPPILLSPQRRPLAPLVSTDYVDVAALSRNVDNHFAAYNTPLSPRTAIREFHALLSRTSSSTSLSSTSRTSPASSHSSSSSSHSHSFSNMTPQVTFSVPINRQTFFSKLIRVDDESDVPEYPETHATNAVGYLHRLDPDDWLAPVHDNAYSWGAGGVNKTAKGKPITHKLLVDDAGNHVPCRVTHRTCQGIKTCKFNDSPAVRAPHISASSNDVSIRLAAEREARLANSGPNAEFFQRTEGLIMSLVRLGCHDSVLESNSANLDSDGLRAHHRFLQRGYVDKTERCTGKIKFSTDSEDRSLLHCEHYNTLNNRSHYVQYIDDGFYDCDYLEAFFSDDSEATRTIEEAACNNGHGPLASCTTVTNTTSRRRHCPYPHRHDDGTFKQALLTQIECTAQFRLYEPLEEYRKTCPYVVVSYSGEHTHAPPLPLTTPQRIRSEIFEIFAKMGEDLADLTPRRFLRHAITRTYICSKLPNMRHATLGDVHPSLANREHLAMYICQAKARIYPQGSGWQGALYLYKEEPEMYLIGARYIRSIIEFALNDTPIKIIVCMSPEASRRLKNAQHIQSDTSYKRIVGFNELVIGHWNTDAHTSLVFCRIYINSETAEAHRAAFNEVDRIVGLDTGSGLRWRHLDARSLTDFVGMILEITGDQGGGQSKGFGLYFIDAAARRPPQYDLHEPLRLITSLTIYEHLHRIFRLCTTHAKRNIRKSKVSESVRNDMRSLMCVRHPDWDGTIRRICEAGGQAGRDWVFDKENSQYVFQAMCWEKSKIPLDVWRSGERDDNLIESSHFDVNQDGRYCSLVSGIEKGRRFDMLKLQSVKSIEEVNIRPSYKTGHPSENQTRSLKRRENTRHKTLDSEDKKIESYNAHFEDAKRKWFNARRTLYDRQQKHPNARTAIQIQNSTKSIETARKTLDQAARNWKALVDTATTLPRGSGKRRAFTFTDVHWG